MAEQLLLYNVLAGNAHKLPVFLCVMYLLKDGTVPQSPFRITFPGGELIHEFRFESIKIGQLTPDDIWLIRRFREMHDIFSDMPIFQEILKEGMEKGIEQGRLECARYTAHLYREAFS